MRSPAVPALIAIACSIPGAAQRTWPCEAPTSSRVMFTGSHEERLQQIRARLTENPHDFFLHRLYIEMASLPTALPEVVEEYKALLDRHAGDPEYLYLYGLILKHGKPREAIPYLEKAAAKAPEFPWPPKALIEIYSSGLLKDASKLLTNVKAYLHLCPDSLEAYNYLKEIDDREFLASAAKRLRTRLAERKDSQAISLYLALWSAEWRAVAAADREPVRRRIAGDMERLKQIEGREQRVALYVVRDGCRLIGDQAGEKAAEAALRVTKPPPNASGFRAEYQKWRDRNPYPSSPDPEKRKAYGQALLKAAGEWAVKYPNDPMPLRERFTALNMLPDTSRADLEAAGEALIRSEGARALPSYPARLHVAPVWLERGIRVEEIPAMLERGLEALDEEPSRAPVRMVAWATLVDAWLQLSQPEKARPVLNCMEQWLDYNKPKDSRGKDEPLAMMYPTMQAQYYERRAALASFEGKKLDAIAFYRRAVATGRSSALAKARALWKELGGSEEAWLAFSEPLQPRTNWTPGPGWSRKDKPLEELSLKDIGGRTWTLANFKGRITLVNVWATWCPPCRAELPYLQKLYDRVKDRADVQVVTLNVDHETDLVEPFLKEHKYTFPVLMASSYLDSTMSIPRNWIVDREGTLREEAVGFGSDGDKWMEATLQKLVGQTIDLCRLPGASQTTDFVKGQHRRTRFFARARRILPSSDYAR
jgi:thiol-disulfide isomerase/thioredoxin